MTTTTKREAMLDRIRKHGQNLLAIFPRAKERDPVKLCKMLRRLEAQGNAIGLRLCNGPEYAEGEADADAAELLARVNRLLGNFNEYQPKTGQKCGCRRGVQRDNCSNCEGTGQVVDFRAIRNRPKLVPIILNRDPRGNALKIDAEDMGRLNLSLHTDMGGDGAIAPDLTDGD